MDYLSRTSSKSLLFAPSSRGFEKFLEQFASDELERLLTYELDERTGEPKFLEGLKAKQIIEDSGLVEELRQREERKPGGDDDRFRDV